MIYLEKGFWFCGKLKCLNCYKFGHEEKGYHFKVKHQANYSENKEVNEILLYVGQSLSKVKKN